MRVAYHNFWPGFSGNTSWFADAIRVSGTSHEEVGAGESPDVLFQCAMSPGCPAERHFPVREHGPLHVFYTGEPVPPDLTNNHCAVSFSRAEDDLHYRLPLYVTYFGDPEAAFSAGSPGAMPRLMRCSALAGNPAPGSPRLSFASELYRRGMLRCGGSAFPDRLGPERVAKSGDAKMRFLRSCAFHMAFENTVLDGYVTEKLPHALAAGVVPLYWGDPRACEDFSPECFIAVPHDGPWGGVADGIKALARRLPDIEAIRNAPRFPASGIPAHWSKERFARWLFGRLDARFRR